MKMLNVYVINTILCYETYMNQYSSVISLLNQMEFSKIIGSSSEQV